MQYTIVGGGIAAYSAVKAIHGQDPDGRITVITDETPPFYYRPMIPLVIDGDRTDEDLCFGSDIETIPNCECIQDRAVSLDRAKKTVSLQSGRDIVFDKLLIATGSTPARPDIPGIENVIHVMRTIRDAERLRNTATGTKEAVILGGGLIGLKTAAALRNLGLIVTVVEKLPHILVPRLDKKAACMVAKRIEKRDFRLITGDAAVRILPQGKGVELQSGTYIVADFVVSTIGVRPCTEWLAGSGIAVEKGIVTTPTMQTNDPDVYAAGDVAQSIDLVSGKPVVSALWTNAVEMGRTAGVSMAGGKRKFPGCLSVMNATELAGIPMISAGSVDELIDDAEVCTRCTDESYKKFVFKDDRLIGTILLGDIRNAGLYTALIRNRTVLGPLKNTIAARTLHAVDFM